jgi:hypothetical protein
VTPRRLARRALGAALFWPGALLVGLALLLLVETGEPRPSTA